MNREALEALREKVDAGVPCGSWDAAMTDFAGAKWNEVYGAYNGSLEAAKALHETLLPGWPYSIDVREAGWASAWTDKRSGLRRIGHTGTCNDNPARAWLLAILSALLAEGGE